MSWLLRLGRAARLERALDAALAARKAQRLRASKRRPTEMQIAARKGAATKRRLRRARDPLLRAESAT